MIYITLLNWNNYQDTGSCIDSLLQIKNPAFRLLIVDNASTDDSYTRIIKHVAVLDDVSFQEIDESQSVDRVTHFGDTKIVVIKASKNHGYGGGNNLGLRYAMAQPDCEYMWVLNNDTEVDQNSLNALVERMHSNRQIGICGSRLVYYYERDKLQGLGGNYNRWLCSTTHYRAFCPATQRFDDEAESKNIDYVIGASLFISKELVERIGYFDDHYFLYFEELDLCSRAQRAGFTLAVASESIVFHKEGASISAQRSTFSEFHVIRSKKLFINKNYPQYKLFLKFNFLVMFLNRLRRREWEKAKQIMKYGILGMSSDTKI